jgi:DNA sulfur modification protein DndC
MIKNDDENLWMSALLELRNEIGDWPQDRQRRDYRRMNGRVHLFHDGVIPGPYKKKWREHWLRRVLEVQEEVRRVGPPEVRDITLISMEELHEIRRMWLYEKRQFDDSVPRIYEEVTGQTLPEPPADDHLLGRDDWELLREICGRDEEFFELQTQLLDVEREFRGMTRRAGIFGALEDRLRACQYGNEEGALKIRQEQEERRKAIVGEGGTTHRIDPQQTLFDMNGEGDSGGEPVRAGVGEGDSRQGTAGRASSGTRGKAGRAGSGTRGKGKAGQASHGTRAAKKTAKTKGKKTAKTKGKVTAKTRSQKRK